MNLIILWYFFRMLNGRFRLKTRFFFQFEYVPTPIYSHVSSSFALSSLASLSVSAQAVAIYKNPAKLESIAVTPQMSPPVLKSIYMQHFSVLPMMIWCSKKQIYFILLFKRASFLVCLIKWNMSNNEIFCNFEENCKFKLCNVFHHSTYTILTFELVQRMCS